MGVVRPDVESPTGLNTTVPQQIAPASSICSARFTPGDPTPLPKR